MGDGIGRNNVDKVCIGIYYRCIGKERELKKDFNRISFWKKELKLFNFWRKFINFYDFYCEYLLNELYCIF